MEFQNVFLVGANFVLIMIAVMLPDRARSQRPGATPPPVRRDRPQPRTTPAQAQVEPEEPKKWPNTDPSYIPNHPLNPTNRR